MKKFISSIYTLVDEEFLSYFDEPHLSFMKEYYYSLFVKYNQEHNLKFAEKTSLFINMRKRKFKLIQMCCPYCGKIEIIIEKRNIKDIEQGYNYCNNCGKGSTSENAFFQLSRILRIQHFHLVGLEVLKNDKEIQDLELLTYDIFQLELTEIASILEVILRDYFNAFIFFKFFNTKNTYLSKIINKDTGNDFMNIEKANDHYKKAININLHEIITDTNWLDLLDISNMRNMIVHNNGMIDVKFKSSKSYIRLKDKTKGNLLFLNTQDIAYYLRVVFDVTKSINTLFDEIYGQHKHALISNYYFNKTACSK